MLVEGKRVNLVPLRDTNQEDFNKWHGSPEVARFLGMQTLTENECIELFDSYLSDKKGVYFSIQIRETGQVIGYTFLTSILKRHKVSREMGIVIGDPNYWNSGYGTEASILISDYGFRVLDLHRIELFVLDVNTRAKHVYEKIGFRVEGIQREARLIDGKWHDVVLMAKINNREEKK